jgi:hypothetical protein
MATRSKIRAKRERFAVARAARGVVARIGRRLCNFARLWHVTCLNRANKEI